MAGYESRQGKHNCDRPRRLRHACHGLPEYAVSTEIDLRAACCNLGIISHSANPLSEQQGFNLFLKNASALEGFEASTIQNFLALLDRNSCSEYHHILGFHGRGKEQRGEGMRSGRSPDEDVRCVRPAPDKDCMSQCCKQLWESLLSDSSA